MIDRPFHPGHAPDGAVDKSVTLRQVKGLDWALHPMPVPEPVGLPRWGVVSTIRAETRDIARFAAWHLDLGADAITIYLDDPQPGQRAALTRPKVTIIETDATHWQHRRKRPDTHQLRQAANASRDWRRCDLDWLVHIDVDEYLLPPAPMTAILAALPDDCALAHFPPVEQLSDGKKGVGAFKKTAKAAGHPSRVLREIYPTFGPYLRGGFLSHLEGKFALRAGFSPRPDQVRFGIHGAFLGGEPITNRVHLPDVPIGHAHAPDWASFLRHLDFRREHGSYRNRDGSGFKFAEVLDLLINSEGEDGLRHLFQEVAEATPDLLSRLAAHDMVLHYDLDLDGALARHYPELAVGLGQ